MFKYSVTYMSGTGSHIETAEVEANEMAIIGKSENSGTDLVAFLVKGNREERVVFAVHGHRFISVREISEVPAPDTIQNETLPTL